MRVAQSRRAQEIPDPYLEATLWVIDFTSRALIVGPEASVSTNVHARTLFEVTDTLDLLRPLPTSDLGLVLAMPTARQLEELSSILRPDVRWFLIPSDATSAERVYQDAWVWASLAPSVRRGDHPAEVGSAIDPTGLLSDPEMWALALRAGHLDDASSTRRLSLQSAHGPSAHRGRAS